MPDYRRAYAPGGTFFLTLVAYRRVRLFADPANVARLRLALAATRKERPFEAVAGVVLLDHLHLLWTLPPGDPDLSRRVGRFKALFTRSLPGGLALPASESGSRLRHRESNVWQRRFWEHTIRDDRDFEQHLAYIHYNPVKHGLATCPHRWEYSSFHHWVHRGSYVEAWCCSCDGRPARAPDLAHVPQLAGE